MEKERERGKEKVENRIKTKKKKNRVGLREGEGEGREKTVRKRTMEELLVHCICLYRQKANDCPKCRGECGIFVRGVVPKFHSSAHVVVYGDSQT